MTLWTVHKYYDKNDNIYYDVMPYNLRGHLKCCLKWYGFKGLKWCYLFKKQAERKVMELNEHINRGFITNVRIKEYPKECPFCHDIPIVAQDPLRHGSHGYQGNHEYYVACVNGNCKVQPRTKSYTDIWDMTAQECVDKSIEDWNDR